MRYLTIDGMFSGTGIRDSIEGGYIKPDDLGLSTELKQKISDWLSRYEDEHYAQGHMGTGMKLCVSFAKEKKSPIHGSAGSLGVAPN